MNLIRVDLPEPAFPFIQYGDLTISRRHASLVDIGRVIVLQPVSQNRYSTALDPFLEFTVHLGVYGKVCLGPPI